MYIINASGEKEKFQPEKIKRTCLRAGADFNLANQIVKKVKSKIYPGITSREILKLIKRYLRQVSPTIAIRYSLKEAIFRLGPAGFHFEKFIARILEEYGYRVSTNNILTGHCVEHEIDLIAVDQEKIYLIECKHHHLPGIYCDLKTALYTWARFLDVNRAKRRFDKPWLVTNTKFSQSAIQYANCQGLKLLGWHWPIGSGLENIIEEKRLYPITILPGLTEDLENRLAKADLILCRDLITTDFNKIVKNTKIKYSIVGRLVNQAKDLLFQNFNIDS